ncbi:hypothetical protein AAFF_G00305270 [Aldrovandia affinis]|uniref:Uncharacterized protein n=1 Tax=Aldrovandia affinis TaxID=143900 RepID=A0AAD7SR88_9TELE|nr:hypothetical protein AAFF_G00305270 [Aldrovandia affinis]
MVTGMLFPDGRHREHFASDLLPDSLMRHFLSSAAPRRGNRLRHVLRSSSRLGPDGGRKRTTAEQARQRHRRAPPRNAATDTLLNPAFGRKRSERASFKRLTGETDTELFELVKCERY